jgi:hypothetical protein
MDYVNKFGGIINRVDDVSIAAEDCNKFCNDKISEIAREFAEWLLYNDEVFSAYAMNKVSIDKLYNRFIDETRKNI